MKRLLVTAAIVLAGFGLLVLGFLNDVFFAGIPFQDPTPALRAQYASDAAIARVLEVAGLLVICLGICVNVVWRWHSPSRARSRET